MAMSDDELIKSINFLGHPTGIGLKGASDIATTPGSPTGLPAMPTGPGGTPGTGGLPGVTPSRRTQFGGAPSRLGPAAVSTGGGFLKDYLQKQLAPGEAGPVGEEIGLPGVGEPIEGFAGLPEVGTDVSGTLPGVGTAIEGFAGLPPVGSTVGAAGEGGAGGFVGGAGSGTAADVAGAGAEAGGAGADVAGASAGAVLGAYGGASAVYDLAKLGFELGLGSEGPSSGNPYMDAVMGLLGPVGDVIGLFSRGAFTPSEAWTSFPQRLQSTLRNEASSLNDLYAGLTGAKTQGDIGQLLGLFQNQLTNSGTGGEGSVGGYQLGAPTAGGAPQIGALPGATGTQHEGGISVDFGPRVNALNQLIQQMYPNLAAGGPSAALSQSAFDYGMNQSQWDFANQAIQGMLSGQQVDISGQPQNVQNFINQQVAAMQQQQQAASYDPGAPPQL